MRHSAVKAVTRLALSVALAPLALGLAPRAARAQQVLSQPERVITVQQGHAAMVTHSETLQRVAVANPKVAEAVVVSGREVLVNGVGPGTTTLVLWDRKGGSRLFEVRVTIDVRLLQEQMKTLFPNDSINVTASGGIILLSGLVRDTSVSRRAYELARTSGAMVQANFGARSARQILLQVRFGEVTRSALKQLSSQLNIGSARAIGNATDAGIQTNSDGVTRLFLLGANAELDAILNALHQKGLFKSLAEPNLVAMDGDSASFLAGGEFPFPVVQGSANGGTVTVVWKEFGVRLRFRPTVTPGGSIRLHVSPEVSSLDFANGLRVQGNLIPSLVTRRADTEVELVPGQHLGIAGLIDNTLRDQAGKIPGLGDIPIIGQLFRTRDRREDQTELLVIVTPYFVQSSPTPLAVPGGEPGTWKWERLKAPPDTNAVKKATGTGRGAGPGGGGQDARH
jgi:pilus assembly protein CpaC